MTTIAQTDAAHLLADLRARYCVEPYDPTQDVTLYDVIAQLGITEHPARKLLEREVSAGRLTLRQTYVGNRKQNVYRKT